jgi:hypothetical protein
MWCRAVFEQTSLLYRKWKANGPRQVVVGTFVFAVVRIKILHREFYFSKTYIFYILCQVIDFDQTVSSDRYSAYYQ